MATLNKFSKFGKIFKLDVGDVFMDNGNCIQFMPTDKTKLPYSNYSYNTVKPNEDIVKAIRSGKISNLQISKKDNLTYYKVTSIDKEDRDKIVVVDKELYCLELSVNNSEEKFQTIITSSMVKKETDKQITTLKDLRYKTLHSKDYLEKVLKDYSTYYIFFTDIEFYSEAEDRLLNTATKELEEKLKISQQGLDKIKQLRTEKGL